MGGKWRTGPYKEPIALPAEKRGLSDAGSSSVLISLIWVVLGASFYKVVHKSAHWRVTLATCIYA